MVKIEQSAAARGMKSKDMAGISSEKKLIDNGRQNATGHRA